MSVDTRGIDLVYIGDFSPAKGRAFEVGSKRDGVLGNLEVAVDIPTADRAFGDLPYHGPLVPRSTTTQNVCRNRSPIVWA